MGPGLTPKKKWKIVPKQSYITTDSWGLYTKCILFVFTMLTILSHYDLNVLFMSVTGFHKKSLDSFVSSIQFFLQILEFFNFAKPLSDHERHKLWNKDSRTVADEVVPSICWLLHPSLASEQTPRSNQVLKTTGHYLNNSLTSKLSTHLLY